MRRLKNGEENGVDGTNATNGTNGTDNPKTPKLPNIETQNLHPERSNIRKDFG